MATTTTEMTGTGTGTGTTATGTTTMDLETLAKRRAAAMEFGKIQHTYRPIPQGFMGYGSSGAWDQCNFQ